jgi:hypothetical protein
MCYFYSLLYRKETQKVPVIGTIPERGCNEVITDCRSVGIGRWMRSAGEKEFCRNNPPKKSIAESILVKIRDMKPLNAEDMDKLNNLSDDDKMEIIGTYNLVVESIQVLVESEGILSYSRRDDGKGVS